MVGHHPQGHRSLQGWSGEPLEVALHGKAPFERHFVEMADLGEWDSTRGEIPFTNRDSRLMLGQVNQVFQSEPVGVAERAEPERGGVKWGEEDVESCAFAAGNELLDSRPTADDSRLVEVGAYRRSPTGHQNLSEAFDGQLRSTNVDMRLDQARQQYQSRAIHHLSGGSQTVVDLTNGGDSGAADRDVTMQNLARIDLHVGAATQDEIGRTVPCRRRSRAQTLIGVAHVLYLLGHGTINCRIRSWSNSLRPNLATILPRRIT